MCDKIRPCYSNLISLKGLRMLFESVFDSLLHLARLNFEDQQNRLVYLLPLIYASICSISCVFVHCSCVPFVSLSLDCSNLCLPSDEMSTSCKHKCKNKSTCMPVARKVRQQAKVLFSPAFAVLHVDAYRRENSCSSFGCQNDRHS